MHISIKYCMTFELVITIGHYVCCAYLDFEIFLLTSEQLENSEKVKMCCQCSYCCVPTKQGLVSLQYPIVLSYITRKCVAEAPGPYLAEGRREPCDKSGLSISRKEVSKVFRDDCAFELPEESFWFPSVPFSILMASCMAKMTSCILGLETPCCCTHCMATSAILHTDSIFTFPSRNGSMMLVTSPL